MTGTVSKEIEFKFKGPTAVQKVGKNSLITIGEGESSDIHMVKLCANEDGTTLDSQSIKDFGSRS